MFCFKVASEVTLQSKCDSKYCICVWILLCVSYPVALLAGRWVQKFCTAHFEYARQQ